MQTCIANTGELERFRRQLTEVRDLERYPRDTAGGIMTTEVTSLPEEHNVEQAITELMEIIDRQDIVAATNRLCNEFGLRPTRSR